MREFGDKSKFYVAYEFSSSSTDSQWPRQTFGEMYFYVNGIDLCRYYAESDGHAHSFKGILFWPLNWIFENLPYMIGFEVFPLPVDGLTAIELCEKAFSREFQNDVDLILWRESLFSWYCRHSWFNDKGGDILPKVVIRCIDDNIEFSWDNKEYLESITFESMTGASYISRPYVKDVFVHLLKAFRNDVMEFFPTNPNVSNLLAKWDKTLKLFEFNLNSYA